MVVPFNAALSRRKIAGAPRIFALRKERTILSGSSGPSPWSDDSKLVTRKTLGNDRAENCAWAEAFLRAIRSEKYFGKSSQRSPSACHGPTKQCRSSVARNLGEEQTPPGTLEESSMRITKVRTRVVEWRGKTVPPQPHFCTNPMDLLELPLDSMGAFRFHNWLIVEIESDAGLIGIGNAGLAPPSTKQVIDSYLKPVLIGSNPFDVEYLWQYMYRKRMAFGRKGIGMVAISAVDIALWDLLGKALKQPVFRLLGGRTKAKIPVYASRLYSQPLEKLAEEALGYKKQGFRAVKLRFGWGAADGRAGMLSNVDLVRTVREGKAVDCIQFDTNRVGGITQARKVCALAEAYSVPVVPHAGQMHNFQVVMASYNCPMAEFFPMVDVEIGNELFWYILKGE